MRLNKSLLGLVAGLLIAFAGITPPVQATPQYTSTHRNNTMTDVVTAIGATGTLMVVTGSQAASVSTADGGTVLVILPLSATAGTVSGGVLTFNAITSANAGATGTAGHFIICTTNNTANCLAGTTRIVQGSVGSSGADLNFSSGGISWTSGQLIAVSSLTLTANGA
jgi:hypothetical protein